ncbi:Hsp20/alpha crystallin family protein [Kribbella sp. NPDC003505]|uniref:Hsp20/alpha crystallin family protein n=1 Tax=Kribbella sp. NPDC003505 TaxID=3154448 RepID=UPI0033B7EC10
MIDRVARRQDAVRWLPTEPFAHLDDIHRRMNQLMHRLSMSSSPATGWTPAVDIEETDDECVIDIDLPGATAGDVVLEWANDRSLTVRGRIPDREHHGVLHRRTRPTGSVHHVIDLPCPVLGDRTTATLTHGVLTVHAAKAHPGPAHRIHIVDLDDPVDPGEPGRPGGVQP